MPANNPTPAMLRPVSRLVKDAVISYANDPADFISEKVLPAFPVSNEATGKFSKMPKRNFYGAEAEPDSFERAAGAGSNYLHGVTFDTVDYACKAYNKAGKVDAYQAMIADVGIDLRKATYKQLVETMRINRERRVASLFFSASFTNTVASSVVGGVPYADPTLGTPISDMLDIISDVRRSSGRRPNGIILSETAAHALRAHETILSGQSSNVDRSLFTEDDLLAWLSRKLKLDQAYIGLAQFNSAPENITVDLDDVWGGGQIWIGHLAPQGSVLGLRASQGVWDSQNVAAVRPVVTDWEPYEFQCDAHNVELGVNLSEDVVLVSSDHGKRITAA